MKTRGRALVAALMALALVASACSDDAEVAPVTVEDTTGTDTGDGGSATGTETADASTVDEAPAPGETDSASSTAAESSPDEPTATATEPVWEEVAGGEGCMCSDGSDWSFWVREADPTKVVLFFQGGGACFSAETCAPDSGSYKATGGSADDPTGYGGVFDFTNPANPLADWSWVFVPYCTGDVHIGDNTQDYGDGLVVEHNGFVNGSRALDELVARFGGATDVVVTGSSAGGVPAPLFAGLVSDALPDADITALADGSGAYADEPIVNAAIGALWGTFGVVPDWPVNADITPDRWSIPGLFVQAGLHDPDIVMARHDHAYDSVQAAFSSAAGVAADDLVVVIDDNAAGIEAAGVEVGTYVAPGTDHTILGNEAVYSQEVEGTAFIDWLTDLVNRVPVDDVHCETCT